MLSGRIRRRALALLGALLLVILVWPPCCATMPAALPLAPPWEMVPSARPHPAASVLPAPPQDAFGGSHQHLRPRAGERPADRGEEGRRPGGAGVRRSREDEALGRGRFLERVLNHGATEPNNERRQQSSSGAVSVPVQLNLPARENSPPRPRDYLIEPIDKNKSHSMLPSAAATTSRTKFDDTSGEATGVASSSQRSRSRRSASPAAGNPHRHQHRLAGPANATGWHGRRGGGGRNNNHQHQHQQQQQQLRHNESNLERNERSANLSHISGATRKIQLFIKNRYVQLLPDGTVNGTHDDLSDYTILQRTTVGIGQIKIQAVATCLFLCMDTCGSVYGSKEFSDDCVFNEQMEQHHYNTYSSTQHSNARRTLYLALNKTGQPRKIQIPVNRTLGKLATYTKALTQTVGHERVEQLVSRLFGPDHVRHGLSQLCESGQPLEELTAPEMRPRPVCGGGQAKLANGGAPKKQPGQANAPGKMAQEEKEGPRQKRKKKRRKCREDELPGEHCFRPGGAGGGGQGGAAGGTNSGKKKAAGQQQQQQLQGQSRGAGGGSSISSSSTSSVGSSSAAAAAAAAAAGSNQSAVGNVGGSSSSISNGSAASSPVLASISSGGPPNRPGPPYAQLTATPNGGGRKAKPTRKQPKQPKKGPGAQQQQPGGPGGKRNATNNKPGPARSKLVAASIVPAKVNPRPASLTIARTPAVTTAASSTTTTSSSSSSSSRSSMAVTVSNALTQDSTNTSEEAELEMDDVLQPSAEFADEPDELDEVPGSPTASSWHELLPARSVSEQRGRYQALSCCSFLSLSSLVVYGATVHLLYL